MIAGHPIITGFGMPSYFIGLPIPLSGSTRGGKIKVEEMSSTLMTRQKGIPQRDIQIAWADPNCPVCSLRSMLA